MKKFLLIISILINTQIINISAMDKNKTEIDPEMQYQEGLSYLENGENEKAFNLIEAAARQNHIEALIEFTYMLYKGKGCNQNLNSALKFCDLIIDESDRLANEAYQCKDEEKENYYDNIYREFNTLYRKITTELLNATSKIITALLALKDDDKLKEKPISEEILNSMFC
ncbi:hypothetical protein KJ644_04530 [Candidatus Dependentiae bacterium]|nr:hypothetical protein [Candidatus Dependentiae bacterium]MBU4387706.1 hypothetical protein [Candidatus Dependentiae bacterium]MCG2755871.1 hypothetical protein [Candidatus Dependentiae bacterium]